MYRRYLSFMLLCCLILLLIIGCSSQQPQSQSAPVVRIGCMKGPTAIGMIHLLSESDAGNSANTYQYTIAGTADELSTALVKGDLDIASVPCNLASILYHKTEGEIVTIAVNTLGVLYLVESGDSIQKVADLKGKTIFSTGQGTTPEYTLRYLLNCAGLDPDKDVVIEYRSEASEVVALLTQNPEAVALLPQPYVMVALNNNPNFHIALDITKEWENYAENTIVTGVIVAQKDFLEEHQIILKDFLEEYQTSVSYVNSNIEDTAKLLEQYDVFKATIANQAIPYCNVVYMDGQEMKENVTAYLQILFDQNPASIGGSLQEGMFYIEY